MTPSGSAELFCHYITWEAFKSTSSFPNKCTSTLRDCLLTAVLSMPNGIIMKIVCWNWLTNILLFFLQWAQKQSTQTHFPISVTTRPLLPLHITPPKKNETLRAPPKNRSQEGGGGKKGGRWRWKRGQGDTSQTSSFSQNAHPLAASPKHVSYRVAAQYTTATHD